MDRRLFLASALALLAPGAALAQSRDKPGGGHGPGGGSGGNPGGGQRPPSGSNGGQRPPGGGSNPGGPGGQRPPGGGPNPGGGRPPGGGGGHPPSGGSRPPPRPQPPMGPYRPGAGRPPGFRPVQGPRWRYPPGYRYRRWTVGLVLPALFLGSAYYYEDYWRMGLNGPPYGCRWVRYGPDLLLVETRTGRIVDVLYGAFY